MVRKREVIAILDARKILAGQNSQVFFDTFRAADNQGTASSREENPIKSFVLIDACQEGGNGRRQHWQAKRKRQNQSMVLVSSIASATLKKRFHGDMEE